MLFGAEFGLGTVAFLWPNLKGGFGSLINAGPLNDIKAQIAANDYVYVGAGRFYVVPWEGTPGTGLADYPAEGVTAEGVMPLYQRCVHLGCRVPFCASSHGSSAPATARSTTTPASTSWARLPEGSIASRWRSSTAT